MFRHSEPGYPEIGPQSSRDLLEMPALGPFPDPLSQHLHFIKIPGVLHTQENSKKTGFRSPSGTWDAMQGELAPRGDSEVETVISAPLIWATVTSEVVKCR